MLIWFNGNSFFKVLQGLVDFQKRQNIADLIRHASTLGRKNQAGVAKLLEVCPMIDVSSISSTSVLIDYMEFYAVSAIFQPCNGGFNIEFIFRNVLI